MTNSKLRSLIRSSLNIYQLGSHVKQSELLVELASPKLKSYATKQLDEINKLAQSRSEQPRYPLVLYGECRILTARLYKKVKSYVVAKHTT